MPAKRKRASTLTSQANDDSTAQVPAPQDVSGEKTVDSVPDDSLKSVEDQSTKDDPPAKRTRSTRSEQQSSSEDKTDDDQEFQSSDDGGENGEAGKMRMDAPPKAGLIDPVGYHTNPPPEGRPVRVYADGVFDLFHLGHMRQLEQAKTAFPNTYLIVGVTGDKETHRRKGLTVLSGKERAETVRHCKWVDEVVEDCPWVVGVDFLESHQIDYVAHDDIPYGADEGDDIYKPVKEKGMFLVTQRTEGVSTTGIITKIVRDYEAYVARQLKRGTSRQELNISWLKKNELDIKRHVAELRDSIKTNWTTTGQELGKELRQFWQPSRQGSPARGAFETPKSRLSHLEVPGSARSSIDGGGRNSDFAAGYAMGLVGGVRSWMQRTRRNLDSVPQSPASEDDSPFGKSPTYSGRGRTGKNVQDEVNAQFTDEMVTKK
ncbi:hypothetical protein AAFC00_003544 [Neodothiora populina]|uniref:choline-phosphate cytidylyltransferase n=1 Tax=Neodothiora populina TaxID=2781224 RepID=A0ABR3PFP5_9PEZI